MACAGKVLVFLLLLGVIFQAPASSVAESSKGRLVLSPARQPRTKDAYVTLLYGEEFALGARVLGQSLRESGTTRDMVLLASAGVQEESLVILQNDGWIIERIELLNNPNSKRPSRFWGVYTKLKIFNMTDYEKVVYLDADTIVMRNIDELFECQGFCANCKHSEKLNSGVMVVEPSKELFMDMLSKIDKLPSYTGGDQGFLNSYYRDFIEAPMFVVGEERRKRRAAERLSTIYNADVGLFVINGNKWFVPVDEIRVMHFTLGPLKPWDWWTAWLMEPVVHWQELRHRLPASGPGASRGGTRQLRWYLRVLALVPLLMFVFLNRHLVFQVYADIADMLVRGPCARLLWYKYWQRPSNFIPTHAAHNQSSYSKPGIEYQGPEHSPSPVGPPRIPRHLRSLGAILATVIGVVSFVTSVAIIPRQARPWTGIVLCYEWTLFLFAVAFGKFLGVVHSLGLRAAAGQGESCSEEYSPGKGHARMSYSWDCETYIYGLLCAALSIFASAFPVLVNVSGILPCNGLRIGVLVVLMMVLTHTAEHLTVRWYLLGYSNRGQARRSGCCDL